MSQIQPTRRQRTKTFTGCWTCRIRHVKCDEGKPACSRCQRADIPCQGYGIRLDWTDRLPSSTSGSEHAKRLPPQSRRRRMRGEPTSSAPYLSQSQIGTILTDLEKSSKPASYEDSPFSVFSTKQSQAICPTLCFDGAGHSNLRKSTIAVDDPLVPDSKKTPYALMAPHIPAAPDAESEIMYESCYFSGTPQSSHLKIDVDNDNEVCSRDKSSMSLLRSGSSSFRQFFPSGGPNNVTPNHIFLGNMLITNEPAARLTPAAQEPLFRSGPLRTQSPQVDRRVSHSPLLRHINLLPIPPQQLELLRHWDKFLCGNMLPIDTVDNPCRNPMLVLAFSGVSPMSREPSVRIAILHATCSVAAQSVSQLKGNSSQFDILAVRHEQLALNHLRHCLTYRINGDLEPILLTILIFILGEAISGRARRWRPHLNGGLDLLRKIALEQSIPEKCSYATLLTYLWMAAFCNVTAPQELVSLLAGIPKTNTFLQQNFGVTPLLLETVLTINKMVSANAPFDPQNLDVIENLLHLSGPSKVDSDHPQSAIVMQSVSNVIYYAVMIHFKRMLRRSATSEIQNLVETAIGELEAADSLGENSVGCSFVWPCLVIGAECDTPELQARMSAWFKKKQVFAFRNLAVIHGIVTRVWQSRASSVKEPGIGWQSLWAIADLDVFPL